MLAGVSCGFVRWREGWATCLFTSGARREFLLIAWLAVFLDGGLDWVDVGSDRNGVGGRRWASGVWRLSQDDARGELTTSSSGTRLLSGASGHVRFAISLKAAAASGQGSERAPIARSLWNSTVDCSLLRNGRAPGIVTATAAATATYLVLLPATIVGIITTTFPFTYNIHVTNASSTYLSVPLGSVHLSCGYNARRSAGLSRHHRRLTAPCTPNTLSATTHSRQTRLSRAPHCMLTV